MTISKKVISEKEKFMYRALSQARRAYLRDEIPVGAVVVKDGKVLARGYNSRQRSKIATHHAEVLAIDRACRKLGDWRLTDCDIYVTLEPCAMCVGACLNARIRKIYFGAFENKAGCCGSVVDIPETVHINHTVQAEGGILQEKCSQIIKDYFENKRKQAEEPAKEPTE